MNIFYNRYKYSLACHTEHLNEYYSLNVYSHRMAFFNESWPLLNFANRRSNNPYNRCPESYIQSPEPCNRSTEPYNQSPESYNRSPESYNQSTEPDYQSTEPDYQSTEPDYQSTEPDYQSTEPDYQSTDQSTESENQFTESENQSTESENQSTEPDESCSLLCFLCLVSGLYFTLKRKALSVIGLVIIFPAHVVSHLTNLSLGFMVEVCRIANNSPDICENFPEDYNKTNCLLPREYWKFSVATTIGAIGSCVSYLLITLVILIPIYFLGASVYCGVHRKAIEKPISLFTKTIDCWFFFHYIVVLFLFTCVLTCAIAYIAFTYSSDGHDSSCVKNAVDIARVIFQLVGLFCAIQSCFIFSKIVCCITDQLEELEEKMNECSKQVQQTPANELDVWAKKTTSESSNQSREILSNVELGLIALNNTLTTNENREKNIVEQYYELQTIDQEFIDGVKPTLDLYGVWFIVHWIFYSLTSVLLSAVIVEMVLDVVSYHISSTEDLVPSTKAEIEAPYILYIVFFTLLHAYLFLYPCFRAAAIANARQKLINAISNKGEKWPDIPPEIQGVFVQYLKSQNFGFKVSFFGAEIPCGLGLAFISLFIAVCGGFLE